MNILQYPTAFILIVAIIISALLTVVNKVVIDQKRMKEINTKVKAYNKRLMKATREKNEPELQRLAKEKPVIMQMQQELMKMQMPLFISMIPFFIVFYLLKILANAQNWGQWLLFPWHASLSLPLFGRDLGWLGWYVVCSMPFTSFFRKLLGVQ